MAKIRALIILDKSAIDKKARVDDALLKVAADYATVQNLSLAWDYEIRDFTGLKFVPYNGIPGDLGVDFAYISSLTKELKQKYGEQYDNIVLCIDPANWQAINPIGGWNMGLFYSGYQVEQVKLVDSDDWLRKIFSMEIFHAMDDFVQTELNVLLENELHVLDFDEDVVHGRKNPPYQAYEYRFAIGQIGGWLLKCFEKRNERYEKYVNQLNTFIDLLKKLILLYRQLLKARGVPEPIYLDSRYHSH